MDAPTPQFVPTTLQRLRCFLDAQGGLKVRPWAPIDDVLDALHDALRSRRRDDAFWQALGALLEALVADQRRHGEAAGRPSPFESIDIERRTALLDELRAALGARRRGRGRFTRLVRTLSAPAAALLLVVAGTAGLGCYGTHGEEGERDADVAADGSGDAPRDVAPDDGVRDDGALDDAALDDAAAPDDAVADDAVAEAEADAACEPDGATLEERIAACVPDSYTRDGALACVAALDASWHAGLASLAACMSCDELGGWVSTCLMSCGRGCNAATTGSPDFDLDAFLGNCGCVLYLAVRFE